MNNLKLMSTFSYTWRLVHNMVSIKLDYDLYNLPNIDDNVDYLIVEALTLTLFPDSLVASPQLFF